MPTFTTHAPGRASLSSLLLCASLACSPSAQAQKPPKPVLELPSIGFRSDEERERYARSVEQLARSARKTTADRDGFVRDPLYFLGRPLTPVRVLIEGALLGNPQEQEGYWGRDPEQRRPPFPFERVDFVAPEGLPNLGYPLGLPWVIPRDQPLVLIELTIVEPGMAEHTPRATGERRIDWLGPECFLQRPVIHRFLRGTKHAERKRALLEANANSPALEEHAEIADQGRQDFEAWARGYASRVFRNTFAAGGLRFEATQRSPLRLLQYRVRAADALGEEMQTLASCTSLEDLHYVLSRIWWFHRGQDTEQVAILIQADVGTVLGWSVAKDSSAAPGERSRVAIVTKPRWAPVVLAAASFDEQTPFEGTAELLRQPRRVAEFYESMGWHCIFEDLAEVLDLIAAHPLAARIAKQIEPTWSEAEPWAVEPKLGFEKLFGGPYLFPDSMAGYVPDFYLDREKCTFDFTPTKFLARPGSAKK
jgi:hypothetical protein